MRLYNLCKHTGSWDRYSKALIEYKKKTVRKNSWREFCQGTCKRLQKVLACHSMTIVGSILKEDDIHMNSLKKTLQTLFKVERQGHRASREDWSCAVCIKYNGNKLLKSFQPLKSPAVNGIFLALLVIPKLLHLLRLSLATGVIPTS